MKFLRNFWCNNDDNFFFFLILKFCYVYTSFYELDDKLCEKQRILKKYCTRNVYTIHKDCRKIDVASFFFFLYLILDVSRFNDYMFHGSFTVRRA